MMKRRMCQASTATALAALTIVLAGCGREPYPTPAEEPPPPPPPMADLYGEPLPPPPPEPAAYPEYTQAPSAPVVIAMAPIPNPPEPAPRRAAPRRSSSEPTYRAAPAPTYRATPAPAPRATAPARPAAPAQPPLKAVPPSGTARVAPPPAVKNSGPVQPPALKAPAAPSATANAASPLGDRSTRLAALETALTEWISREAELNTPDRFTANQPAEVTLTIPAEFAAIMREEAAKNDLTDAAASVNVTSILSGDGFSVTPDATQSRPLTAGQPTEFQWTVTAQTGQRGPLHADVGADLLGAGSDTLSLGAVQSGGGFSIPGIGSLSPRAIGIGILALIALLIVGLLARGRSTPSRSASARRESRRARRDTRPVSFSENEI
jgi:hypothetical protein